MTKITDLTETESLAYADAIADALCWFRGFQAARPEAPLPPGIDRLRDLSIALKDHAMTSMGPMVALRDLVSAVRNECGFPAQAAHEIAQAERVMKEAEAAGREFPF